MTWTRIVAVVALVFLVPLAFYWMVRFWLVGYRSRFPDIDHGLERRRPSLGPQRHLATGGARLPDPRRPVGGPGAIDHGCLRERVRRAGRAGRAGALHWYANADRIYLVCSEVGWLSRINREVHQAQLATSNAAPDATVAEA